MRSEMKSKCQKGAALPKDATRGQLLNQKSACTRALSRGGVSPLRKGKRPMYGGYTRRLKMILGILWFLPEPYILCDGEIDGRFQVGEGLTRRRPHLLCRGWLDEQEGN